MKKENLLAVLCLLCSVVLGRAAVNTFGIRADNQRYVVARGGALDSFVGEITFVGGIRDISLRQSAFALLSTKPRPGSAFVNQKINLLEGTDKVGEVFFLGANADKGVAVFTPPQMLKKGGSLTFTVKGDLAQQDANNWEQRGIDIVLAFDGHPAGLEGTYAVDEETGQNIFSTVPIYTVLGETRIFRNVPEFRMIGRSTNPFVGSHISTVAVKNPDQTQDIAMKKLSYKVAMFGVKDATFMVSGDSIVANIVPVRATNGVISVLFDSNSEAKRVSASAERRYALFPVSLEYDPAVPVNLRFIYADILPDTGVPYRGVMGTVAEIESGRENQNNIIWSPFSGITSPRMNAETEGIPDWTNSYGLPGLPFVASWNIPQLAGLTVFKDDGGHAQFVTVVVRGGGGGGGFIPPYYIEASTDIMHWTAAQQIGGAGGGSSGGSWVATHMYEVDGLKRFFRLINQ